jgi:nucleotide-binding universal stress UspA family protein
MYSRILVPLDGSSRAERSVPVAALLARATHGSVVLVQSLGLSGAYGAFEPNSRTVEVLQEAKRDATAYLTRISGLPVLSGIPTETGVFTGPAAVSILDAVIAYKADAVVITSHGRTGLPRWALGSVAEHVIRHATVPVMVLRERGSSPAEPVPGRVYAPRVLVGLDGSSLAEAVLEPAIDTAKAMATPDAPALHLALVVSPSVIMEAGMSEQVAMATANGYLASVAEKIRTRHAGVVVTWKATINADAASGLLRVAENADNSNDANGFGTCSVIALATHGRSGLSRWMFGSVTERVLHTTTLPMLIVRPGPVEEKAATNEAEGKSAVPGPITTDLPTYSALF